MLVHLSHTQFLDQKLFDSFQLADFLSNLINFLVPFLLKELVVLPLLVLNNFLTFDFHMDELTLVLVNVVAALLFAEVVHLFVLDSLFEHGLFLGDHHALHPDDSLLGLRLAGSHLVCVIFLKLFVFLHQLLYFFEFVLLSLYFFFQFTLVPVPGFE